MGEAVANPEVVTRVHLNPEGEVDGHAIAYPIPIWTARNPGWPDSIIMHSTAPIGPKPEETMLFRYAATRLGAAPGLGTHLITSSLRLFQQLGYKAAVCETLLEPYYNRPAHLVLPRRANFSNVGCIDESYGGQDYTWRFYRKIFEA
jgi:hypothetical protein